MLLCGMSAGDCGTGAGGRELKLEGSADADFALDVNLAGVLLHDAVADGKAQAGALVLAFLRLGLGGEEGIVDAVQMLALDAACRCPECEPAHGPRR